MLKKQAPTRPDREPIAIVGMACRFAGAANPREFWKMLLDGRTAVGDVPSDRWDRGLLYDPDGGAGRLTSWRGGFLADIKSFDWQALRMLPGEARHTDPQQRLLLELAWEALEDAGMPLEAAQKSRTGVFVGIMWNDYFRLLAKNWAALDGYALIGNPLMFAANRVSFALDLQGPSTALDSGCASSLVAFHAACQSLWLGESETALVGAVELILSPDSSIALQSTGMLSRSGSSRVLDDDADGFVRGEGGGIVLLKPLRRVSTSERVYAVVRGIAVNHSGRGDWLMASSGGRNSESFAKRGGTPASSPPTSITWNCTPPGTPRVTPSR